MQRARSHRRTFNEVRRALALVVVAYLHAGCPSDPTEIVVTVNIDPQISQGPGANVDAVRVSASAPGATATSRTAALVAQGASGLRLPAALLAVTPRAGDPVSSVWIRAEGLSGGRTVIDTLVLTSFVRGHRRDVTLTFSQACLGVVCSSGESCAGGTCTAVEAPDGGNCGGVPCDGGPPGDACVCAPGQQCGMDSCGLNPCGMGTCPSGFACDATGVCLCVPASCSERCGNVSDSCGGMRDCGSCPSPQTCDATGHCR